MQRLFWNPAENRLRTPWRLLITAAIYVLLVRGSRWLAVSLIGARGPLADTTPSDILRLAGMLVALVLVARYVDKRSFSDYGLHVKRGSWWVDFIFSLLITSLLISVLFWAQVRVGWITISDSILGRGPLTVASTLALPLLNTIATAVYIELFFRGYLIVNLAEGFMFLRPLYQVDPALAGQSKLRLLLNSVWQRTPSLAAWVVATLLFMLVRTEPGMRPSILLLNLLRASFLLTLPFILTRSLAIPIGLNLGWNLATRNIYGLKLVSGGLLAGDGSDVVNSVRSLLMVLQSGPENLTGGALGPEAGLLGMAAVIVTGVLVTLWVQLRYKPMKSERDPWSFTYQPV